ncbi:hypothetical protein [Maritimibacter sp. DP1N21-5]|uniref:hypothetical protein n=1 Tax=Maritimibacter sp. DP1N21-5 TaxID=2836867 RepID=UPI001C48E920|nr:hypothetical protein [Maritimibacter sp. DP1N21-5]MBV7409160.1 hypothetical protein [Maritimibacter sp. DP1N21-5]
MQLLFESENIRSLLTATSLFALSLFVAVFALSSYRRSRYEGERLKLEIEIMRRSLENKVYEATEKMTATNNRWKDVNGLLLEAADGQVSSTTQGPRDAGQSVIAAHNFLADMGIDAASLLVEEKKCFVLTPLHPRFQETYVTIRNTLTDIGLRVTRGDEVTIQSNLLKYIVRQILTSEFIVANIDGRNPNVFYEIGIAHALGKDVVLVASNPEEIPFDLSNQRIVLWSDLAELDSKLGRAIAMLKVANRTNEKL